MSARRKYAADASLHDPWDRRRHVRHKPVGTERGFAPPPGGRGRQQDHNEVLLLSVKASATVEDASSPGIADVAPAALFDVGGHDDGAADEVDGVTV
jgi:hypothetical protein